MHSIVAVEASILDMLIFFLSFSWFKVWAWLKWQIIHCHYNHSVLYTWNGRFWESSWLFWWPKQRSWSSWCALISGAGAARCSQPSGGSLLHNWGGGPAIWALSLSSSTSSPIPPPKGRQWWWWCWWRRSISIGYWLSFFLFASSWLSILASFKNCLAFFAFEVNSKQ